MGDDDRAGDEKAVDGRGQSRAAGAGHVLARIGIVLLSQVLPFGLIVIIKVANNTCSGLEDELYRYVDGGELINIASLLFVQSFTFLMVDCRENADAANRMCGVVLPITACILNLAVGAVQVASGLDVSPWWLKCSLVVFSLVSLVLIECARHLSVRRAAAQAA